MSTSKPIRILAFNLTGQWEFYATQHYKQEGDQVVITGKKYDVTQDVARGIVENGIEFKRVDPEAKSEVDA